MEDRFMYSAEMEPVANWPLSVTCRARVWRPHGDQGLSDALAEAGRRGLTVIPAGNRCSYSDEFLNPDHVVLDLTGHDRIRAWDAERGEIVVDSGCTLDSILRHCLPQGWCLPVVPGTRHPSVGGCIANNVHGKNCWGAGNFGSCVRRFSLLAGTGDILECSRHENECLFQAVIGGMGLLGIILDATLALRQVPSGLLMVHKEVSESMGALIDRLENLKEREEYIIGQVDTFAPRLSQGRGTIHAAHFIPAGAQQKAAGVDQGGNDRLFGVLPADWAIAAGRLTLCDATMWAISAAKYWSDAWRSSGYGRVEPFYAFNFLLDRLPGWRRAFSHGFLEYEALVPAPVAVEVFSTMLGEIRRAGVPAYLGAVKRHRPDDFLMSFAMDGYSIGLDFPLWPARAKRTMALQERLNEMAVECGGLVYFAKDTTLNRGQMQAMYPQYERFLSLKQEFDPGCLFRSAFSRRLFDLL